jgi:hypothetical protein
LLHNVTHYLLRLLRLRRLPSLLIVPALTLLRTSQRIAKLNLLALLLLAFLALLGCFRLQRPGRCVLSLRFVRGPAIEKAATDSVRSSGCLFEEAPAGAKFARELDSESEKSKC